ncbi:hypothetical protein ACHAXR_002733 [Thalassiosira sp. AJA248-18]
MVDDTTEAALQLSNNGSSGNGSCNGDDGMNDASDAARIRTDSILSNKSKSLFGSSSLVQRNISERDNAGDMTKSQNGNSNEEASIETILHEYTLACQIYGCSQRINPGILTTFRFSLPTLRVSGAFFDADMLALAEVLLKHCNGALKYIRRLDFSLAAVEGKQLGKKGMRSHGAYALSRVLQMSMHIEEVFLPGNKIGPYGASAIFCAAKSNPKLRTLLMRGCRIGERGAFAFISQILMEENTSCGLREVDLSVNRLGFYGVFAVEKGLKTRMELLEGQHKQKSGRDEKVVAIEVDLEGNMVFQEVMNCVTHGLGIFLAMIGTILLSQRVRGKPSHYVVSCAVYSVSLIVLYLSSTLFHSMFALARTRYVFQVFDMCAIYILIAGSYTPFLSIALHHKPMWSGSMLSFIWICGLSGIGVEALLPVWKHKPKFSLAMYLGMGWSCLMCMADLVAILPTRALYCLVAGGVAYTSGVPFFVRNNNLDHSIWHCFVMAGSIFHWLCVYLYVVNL